MLFRYGVTLHSVAYRIRIKSNTQISTRSVFYGFEAVRDEFFSHRKTIMKLKAHEHIILKVPKKSRNRADSS